MTVLGTANLILDITNSSLDVKSVIIILALFLFGIGDITRSLSQKMSREGGELVHYNIVWLPVLVICHPAANLLCFYQEEAEKF